MYIAANLEAFTRLKKELEDGRPCTNTPSATDPLCGKTIKTYVIAGTENCEWSFSEQWFRTTYLAKTPTDVFVVVASDPARNRRKNLLEIHNVGKTFQSSATDLISECVQQHMCMFAFDFAASQAVVVKIGTANEDPTSTVEIWTYCQSRDWFFVLIFCIFPIICFSFISFLIVRKFSPTHNLAYL